MKLNLFHQSNSIDRALDESANYTIIRHRISESRDESSAVIVNVEHDTSDIKTVADGKAETRPIAGNEGNERRERKNKFREEIIGSNNINSCDWNAWNELLWMCRR